MSVSDRKMENARQCDRTRKIEREKMCQGKERKKERKGLHLLADDK